MFGLRRLFKGEPEGGAFNVEYTFSYLEGYTETVVGFLGSGEERRPWMVKIAVTDEDAKTGLCSGHTKHYTRYGRSKRHALRKGRAKAREVVRSAREAAKAKAREAEVVRERL